MMSLKIVPCLLAVLLCKTESLSRQHHARSTSSSQDSSRRRLLLGSSGIFLLPPWVPDPSFAAAPTNPGELIRRSAANIPGYGPTDVFYPLSFAGRWTATREIVASEELLASELPLKLSYEVRFLPSVEDSSVVADRGFNTASALNALERRGADSGTTTAGSRGDPVRSYEWDIANPNDLRLTTEGGKRTDLKVTKRSTERTDETVSSSEFQRILTERIGGGPPAISAHRVLAKWKVANDRTIEGIEITYDVGGSLGDPLAASASSRSAEPRVISKSRIRLERLS